MLVRRLCGIFAASLILATVSCASPETKLLDYQNGLSTVSVDMEYGLEDYSCDIVFDGDIPEDYTERRSATVTFTQPEEISGLSVRYTKDKTEASVGKVTLDLPGNTGNELYLAVKLFSLTKEEIAEENGNTAKFRSVVAGTEAEFDVTYKDGTPQTAKILWSTGEMNIRRISIKK